MAKPTEAQLDKAINVLQGVTLEELTERQATRVIELGVDLIRKDYWADVRGVTAGLIERVKEGEISDQEGLEQALNEAVEGTQRVIYTFQAKLGMLATNNPDAWEELGLESPTVEQMMFCAMEADVRAQLEAEDVESLFGGDEDDE
jgi:hypothetical protein